MDGYLRVLTHLSWDCANHPIIIQLSFHNEKPHRSTIEYKKGPNGEEDTSDSDFETNQYEDSSDRDYVTFQWLMLWFLESKNTGGQCVFYCSR